jgi:hypothetical protein
MITTHSLTFANIFLWMDDRHFGHITKCPKIKTAQNWKKKRKQMSG